MNYPPPGYEVYDHHTLMWNWTFKEEHGCCGFESRESALRDAWDHYLNTKRVELIKGAVRI